MSTSQADRRVLRLHLGCGLICPADWVNIDGSWNAKLAKYPLLRSLLAAIRLIPRSTAAVAWPLEIRSHDLRKRLPYPDGAAEAIYASHLLEHLHRSEAQRLLVDCYRVLQPGGVIRLVVPDLRSIIDEYMGQDPFGNDVRYANDPPADRLNKRLRLREEDPARANPLARLNLMLNDFHSHKWMYDTESLSHLVRAAGFADVCVMAPLRSRIARIEVVEDPGRILKGEGICIEAVKLPTSA